MRAIKEFAVQDDLRLGEHILQEQSLAPADVGEDHVGDESRAPELRRAGGHAPAAVNGAGNVGVPSAGGERRHVVCEQAHAGNPQRARQVGLFADAHDLVALPRVVRGDVAVLAGEVLVDEKNAHQTGSRIARRR